MTGPTNFGESEILPLEQRDKVRAEVLARVPKNYRPWLHLAFPSLCGIAFVTGRYVPLATVVIAPVIINIFLYHAFVDTSGLPVAIFLVAANIFVAYYYRKSYAGLLAAK